MDTNLTERSGEHNPRTDWERRYQTGDTGWDQGQAAPAVREALCFFEPSSRILVPGCGLGHDANAFAVNGHRVEGWDLSPTAIRGAGNLYQSENLRFREIDVLRTDNSLEGEDLPVFDGIFEHTFLCAIGPNHWPLAMKRYADLLPSGGRVFAVLFTGLKEENTPPWRIEQSKARDLFSLHFEIESVRAPHESFAHRRGEETVWRMRRK